MLFEKKGKCYLHEMHVDHLANGLSSGRNTLAPQDRNVHVRSSSDVTEIQGVYIKDRFFTSQRHLEFNEKFVRSQIKQRLDSGSIQKQDEEQADEARATAS